MKISRAEQIAIIEVLAYGEAHGYGNLITHLQTAWAKQLMRAGVSEKMARFSTGRDGSGYPFQMQDDLITRGEWGRNRRTLPRDGAKEETSMTRRDRRAWYHECSEYVASGDKHFSRGSIR